MPSYSVTVKFLIYLVSCSNIDGDIKLIHDNIVQVYNERAKEFLSVCWVKDMHKNILNTICRQLGSAECSKQ